MCIASQEVPLTVETEFTEDSKPKRPRSRRPRRRRPQEKHEECQQQSRGDSRTSGSVARPSRQKDLNSTSGSSRLVDLKVTSRFHYADASQQPSWLVDHAHTRSPLVERTPPLQTNLHAVSATWRERMHSHQPDNRDTDLGPPWPECGRRNGCTSQIKL